MSMLDKIKKVKESIKRPKEKVVGIGEKIKNSRKSDEERIVEEIENNLRPILILSYNNKLF